MYKDNAMKEDSERRYRWVERWLRDDDRMKKDLVGQKIFQFDNNMVESGDKENTVADKKGSEALRKHPKSEHKVSGVGLWDTESGLHFL